MLRSTIGGFCHQDYQSCYFQTSASRENIMVHNPYNFLYFIKDDKRERRKQGNSSIPRVFPILKDKFSSVSEFNTFLCSDENGTRL